TVKPLVEKMSAASLSPRTVNKYVEYIKQVVKSLKAPNGEPVHKRTWDAETMDLPIVNHSEQKRPSLKAKAISKLITDSTGQVQPENLDCCFRQQTVHHIFTTSWKIAGSRHASSRWGWMRKAWVGIRSSDSVKHGCVVPDAWKISTISGWLISRKRCRKSTHT